ncbi:hypothetical protein Tco_1526735, partial [Tanacetum coccineum]
EVKDLWPQLLVGDLCQADLIGDEFHSGFELSVLKVKSKRESHLRWEKSQLVEEKVYSRGDLLEDDIENLKRSERFRSEDVIEMKKNDVHI